MNIIKSFNQTIDYLETVLDDEIDEKKIAQLSGYSFAMFSRLFSILTDTKLSEYLRSRRLTKAAIALRNSNQKIVDLAVQFGYGSADSFGAAFKDFHGVSPSAVRGGKPFKVVSRVQLTLSIKGGRNMNITIQKKAAFTVAGVDQKNISSDQCPSVWQELTSRVSEDALAQLGNGEFVGVCHDIVTLEHEEDLKSNWLNYLAGSIVIDREGAQKLGLDILEIEETEYAVVELKGKVPDCIQEGWKYAMEVFLPEQGYIHSGKPDLEYYLEGDMQSPDYKMELWIPITRG